MRVPRFLVASVVVLGLVAGATALFAEDLDVPRLFDSAKASFAEKKYGKCMQDLQLVVAEVGRFRVDALKAALPAAPTGWTAEEAEGTNLAGWAWLGGGVSAKRRYTKGEETSAEVEVWADAGPMLMGFQMLLQNPALAQASGQRVVTVKGRRAVLEYRKDDKSGSLTILLNVPSSMVKIDGRNMTQAELSEGFPAALDLDGLEKAIAN